MTCKIFTEACPPSSNGVYRTLFSQLILSLLNSTCDIISFYPKDTDICNLRSVKFDFIIVGAGSTGSVIANRLTEVDRWNILLVEAGHDPPIESDVPVLSQSLWKDGTAFEYSADESPSFCRGQTNKRCFIVHGRMMGGSSSINGLVYARGSSRDFDRWAKAKNDGWSYADVLPYFKKLEDMRVQQLRRTNLHGFSGYQYVGYYSNNETREAYVRIQEAVKRAALEAGLPFVVDIATKTINGVGRSLGIVKDGVRQNAAKSFLCPISGRKNLYVLKDAFVTRILIDERKRAFGVTIYKNNTYFNVTTCKEVIVSAGTLHSPQLLMHSGIGPEKHLKDFRLKVIQDLPVGHNLQDHLQFRGALFTYTHPHPRSPTDRSDDGASQVNGLYNYLTKRTAELAVPGGVDATLYYDTTGKMPTYPNLHFAFSILRAKPSDLTAFGRAQRLSPEIIDELMGIKTDYIVLPSIYVWRPSIRGRVYLRSADPLAKLGIDMDFPKDPRLQSRRMRRILEGIEFFARLNGTASFLSANMSLHKWNISGCDGSWECVARYMTSTSYHHVGTCKMGPRDDPQAVVDHTLKVHGIRGLRVADASIMPHIPAGNTNIPCMMIGEKTADMIKTEWCASTENTTLRTCAVCTT